MRHDEREALAPPPQEPKKKSNPLIFLREVRSEAARVTWPTRSETVVTTVMVFIMVFLAAVFFFLADQILSSAVGYILRVFA